MRISGALPRWSAASAVALLLAFGVLTVGVPASSSHPTKAAGLYRLVQLELANKSKTHVRVSVCAGTSYDSSKSCPVQSYDLAPGTSKHLSSKAVTGVVSSWTAGHGWGIAYLFRFSVQNPALDLPYIQLTPQKNRPGEGRHALKEGQSLATMADYFDLTLSRGTDTSRVKVMTITINKTPNE